MLFFVIVNLLLV